MPARQVTFFRIGCWMAILTAVVHLAAHVAGPSAPATETEATLLRLATEYRFTLPGAERSLMDLTNGFSLSLSLVMALWGGVGLVVAKRGHGDRILMLAVARAMAAAGLGLLVISFAYFFLIPSVLFAAITLAFAFASVRAPDEESGRT